MVRHFRHPAAAASAALWLAVTLALFPWFGLPAEAQTVSSQIVKGFVTARTYESITVLAGHMPVRVSIDASTRITGQRTTLGQIAVNDVVRVEGRMVAPNRLQAREIDVVLAAGTLAVARQAGTGITSAFWAWLLNGGLSLPLP